MQIFKGFFSIFFPRVDRYMDNFYVLKHLLMSCAHEAPQLPRNIFKSMQKKPLGQHMKNLLKLKHILPLLVCIDSAISELCVSGSLFPFPISSLLTNVPFALWSSM